ncbi:Cytochrome P450 2J2 [Hypsibius exemplaris]|uniref:Cytochrome P450 2J2 n=1 Tax=Hypsibius exemplaris TaxID=2072580 RepID=A0A1W0WJ69_HYPEX|nr:Cytochrome P450 2J2 [Hypsibius exemplaris]
MDSSWISLPIASAILIGILSYLSYWYKHRNIPPGPRGLPFLGYAPFFGPNPQDTFLELGKKYGNVFSLYMGPKLAIVLNDYESIKAAFTGQADNFAGRGDGFVFRYIMTGRDGKIHGIALGEGEIWRTTRRFMLQTFRDLGMGKSKLQDRILDEADYMTDIFAQHKGRPFDPFRTLFSSVSNVVCTLCFGQRFDHGDPSFQQILHGLEEMSSFLGQAGPLQSYPLLRFVPGRLSAFWKKIVIAAKKNDAFLLSLLQKHRETYAESDTRDYIDAFLHQQHKEAKSTEGVQPAFQDEEMLKNLRSFFGAGTETTAVTLQWALLFMLHHPEVQDAIHRELDGNIEAGKSVALEDRVKLPYLEAVTREVQRLANVTPFGVLRANFEETTLLRHRIPKRCFILPNFKAVNIDPELWADPLVFRPERFLDGNGKVSEPPQFMPFSIGKRACVGEALARMEIFLFFANIMQRFQLRAPNGSPAPPLHHYTTSISCRPLLFQLEAIPRL